MAMTEKTQPGAQKSAEPPASRVSQDERLAAMVSAYLDGELMGKDLADFETLLSTDEALAREVAELRRIDRQLMEIGADVLLEPVPESLLEALSRFSPTSNS